MLALHTHSTCEEGRRGQVVGESHDGHVDSRNGRRGSLYRPYLRGAAISTENNTQHLLKC
jgi:hypothetical protein